MRVVYLDNCRENHNRAARKGFAVAGTAVHYHNPCRPLRDQAKKKEE